MSIASETREDIIKKYQLHENDVGSPEVQVALLTSRIVNLTEHIKIHKHDYHNRKGLLGMVGKRNRLLRYIAKCDRSRYQSLIERLGLRK